MKLLLFDVDQTLINTGGAGIRALNRACQKLLSVENAMDGITPHGKTDPAIVREILLTRLGNTSSCDSDLESVIEAYLSFLREEVQAFDDLSRLARNLGNPAGNGGASGRDARSGNRQYGGRRPDQARARRSEPVSSVSVDSVRIPKTVRHSFVREPKRPHANAAAPFSPTTCS